MPSSKVLPSQRSSRTLIATLALAAVALTLLSSAQAQTETVLFNILGGADGTNPRSGLTSDASGNLYATTEYGGGSSGCPNGCGAALKFSPASGGGWTEIILHSFTGGSDGGNPYGSLVADSSGNLYGTASRGGNLSASACVPYGCGVVFEFSPNSSGGWTETVLHTFDGERDGAVPWTSLTIDSTGNLYGTAASGGNLTVTPCAPYGCGVVFELSQTSGVWKETVLQAFSGTNGWQPFGTLTFDASGNLYGTTLQGGIVPQCESAGCGIVFKLSPAEGLWKETVLHTFTGPDGSMPEGGVAFDSVGNLYGTAATGGENAGCDGEGCGTVFELSPTTHGPWKFTGLHAFSDKHQQYGFYPSGTPVLDSAGNLYCVTGEGGAFKYGVAFKLALNSGVWQETVLHSFNSTTHDGTSPYGGMVSDSSGTLYGADMAGGKYGVGAIFEITP